MGILKKIKLESGAAKGCVAVGLALLLGFGWKLPVQAAVTQADLANPVVDVESHKPTDGTDTHISMYKYVYFGNYPQTELKGEEITGEIKNASYDKYGNATVNGKQYRRVTYGMTTIAGLWNDTDYDKASFQAEATDGYRYFVYEPIKWKILENKDGTLFLWSDKALDVQLMDSSSGADNVWENSGLRKWLNYDGTKNVEDGRYYKNPGFMEYAFTDAEQVKIQLTYLTQDDNPKETYSDGSSVSGGKDTEDKLFILNYTEATNPAYGFCSHPYHHPCLLVKYSDYAKAMCMPYSNDYADYWLRTPGTVNGRSMYISSIAGMVYTGIWDTQDTRSVVPALKADYKLEDCIKVTFQTQTDKVIEDQILLGSNYAVEPDTLTKSEYEFTGWYFDKECTKQYCFDEKLTKDTTLYAGWKKMHKKGEIIKSSDNKAKYKVTKAGTTGGTVEYVAPVNKKAKIITIPAIITVEGTTYKVTSIAKDAFKQNKKVTVIKIGSNVATIGKNAFNGCKNLKTVKLGSNVTTIGDKAFYKCTALTSITLPKKVNKIGKQVFYGCKKLKKITIKTTKLTGKKVGSKAFGNIYKKATVKVPKSKVKAYKKFLYKKGLNKKVTVKKY